MSCLESCGAALATNDPPHSGNFGAGIAERLKAVGIEHEINDNNDYARMKWPDLFGFIAEKFKK